MAAKRHDISEWNMINDNYGLYLLINTNYRDIPLYIAAQELKERNEVVVKVFPDTVQVRLLFVNSNCRGLLQSILKSSLCSPSKKSRHS